MASATSVAALILRFLTLMLLIASLAIIATDKIHYPELGSFGKPYDITFKDYYACRGYLRIFIALCIEFLTWWFAPPEFAAILSSMYVLSVAAVGCAYTVLVIPFAIISSARQKRIGGSMGATMFLIFADVVFGLLFATGGAAGLGWAADIQRRDEDDFDLEKKNFYDAVDASCGLLLAATICMVAMIMLSVHSLK